jgi:hypothetical protein
MLDHLCTMKFDYPALHGYSLTILIVCVMVELILFADDAKLYGGIYLNDRSLSLQLSLTNILQLGLMPATAILVFSSTDN